MRFLASAELHALDSAALEELLGRTELLVAAAAGEVRGLAAAALLFADYAVLDARATLQLDGSESWAGVTWRIGRKALLLHLEGRTRLDASQAKALGLVDERIEGDPAMWLERWMQGRNEVALDSAAALIRHRGGDPLERAEFARLFAIGAPQQGLRAFLSRKSNFV